MVIIRLDTSDLSARQDPEADCLLIQSRKNDKEIRKSIIQVIPKPVCHEMVLGLIDWTSGVSYGN